MDGSRLSAGISLVQNPPLAEPAAPHVRRLKTLRRKREGQGSSKKEIVLETVLGVTASTNAALSTNPVSGLVAYTAGCTVVLSNSETNKQQHIINPGKKAITCVGWSDDGRYLVTGECGKLPCVRVWDMQDMSSMGTFSGHKYGISCVAFAPGNKYVVSVGSQHDMIVNVWDWRNNIKVASNKVSAQVRSISFAENGSYFVTAGNRHVKFWYLKYPSSAKEKDTVLPLLGRPAILGEQRNNMFSDVACGKGEMVDHTYTVTKSGLLCQFNNHRILEKWVELKTDSSACLSVGEYHIYVGCAGGVVRCFSPLTLQYIFTLPKPHHLGVDITQGGGIPITMTKMPGVSFAEAIAVSFDEEHSTVTVIYNDHSIYVWDVENPQKVEKISSSLFHSACIWGVGVHHANSLQHGCVVTCSSDDTVRAWNLNKEKEHGLERIIYFDPQFAFLKDSGSSAQVSGKDGSYDQKNGVRCVSISPDGEHLASGDRAGNIRIHHLQSMKELCRIEAHDAEVLSLQYSNCREGATSYLASASRDRLIHVFDVKNNYEFLNTLDDHSSSITAVRFTNDVDGGGAQMVSCGADKTIIFRKIKMGGDGLSTPRANQVVSKSTLYDMEMDIGGNLLLTACQDRNIRVYSVGDAKQTRIMKGSASEDGSLIKVVLDKSGSFYATSCTDKTVAVYNYKSGELLATLTGHSELVTGLAFSQDGRHLITVSGDSCVFVWRLPDQMVTMMKKTLAVVIPEWKVESEACDDDDVTDTYEEEFGSPPPELLGFNEPEIPKNTAYRFSVGKLPAWAKPRVSSAESPQPQPIDSLGLKAEVPRGKWGKRQMNDPALNVLHFDDDDDYDDYDDVGDVSTMHEYPRKTLFDDTDALLNDESVNEFKINAMDAEELRKSVRKQKIVRSFSANDNEDDTEEGFDEPNIESEECGLLDNTNPDERRDAYLKSTFDSLSQEAGQMGDKSTSISNAWREGNTPIQMKMQTKSLLKMMVDTNLKKIRGKSIDEELSSIPVQAIQFKNKSVKDNPNASSSTPERKTPIQKACSLLDLRCQDSPPNLEVSLMRRGSGDNGEEDNFSRNKDKDSSVSILSRLGQHRKMLAGSKKEREDILKKPSTQSAIVKERSIYEHDVPNYMKPTVAKSKKEKVTFDTEHRKIKVVKQEVVKLAASEDVDSEAEESNTLYESTETEELGPVNVSREPLSHKLACTAKMQQAADQLVLVYKRVSLDDALDDSLREELLAQLSEGAAQSARSLALLHSQDDRSQGEIATTAMATINQFLAKQNNQQISGQAYSQHFQDLVENLDNDNDDVQVDDAVPLGLRARKQYHSWL